MYESDYQKIHLLRIFTGGTRSSAACSRTISEKTSSLPPSLINFLSFSCCRQNSGSVNENSDHAKTSPPPLPDHVVYSVIFISFYRSLFEDQTPTISTPLP